jgi:uracil-DNA glycosylase family 4
MPTIVPNVFPRHVSDTRLAIIGEAPGRDEEENLSDSGLPDPRPFVGASGRLLKGILGSFRYAADQCFFGNVCQIRPPSNDIESFDFQGEEIQTGLAQLRDDLSVYNPNCVLLLGRTALKAFKPDVAYFDKGKEVVPIGSWRGSIFHSTTFGYKSVASYHPAYVLRAYGELFFLKSDIQRAILQSSSKEWSPRARHFITRPTLSQVVDFLSHVRTNRLRVALDVEGYNDNVGITMVSFFTSPTVGIVIPFWLAGKHYWSEGEEVLVWEAIAAVAADGNVPKIVQNATYEMFIFAWKHKIILNNISEDTMLKWWELFPEFEKSLAVQTSVLTEEPYYKDERTSGNDDIKLVYNAKDSAVTYECLLAEDMLMRQNPRSEQHYRRNIELLPAINYMHLRGCRFDHRRAESHIEATTAEIARLGGTANLLKKTKSNESSLTGGVLGELVGRPINAKSTPDKQWLLYDLLGYKPYVQFGTSTEEVVLYKYWAKERNPAVKALIQLVNARTRKSDIGKLSTNEDGRIRSNYNLAGTNTARLNSQASNALVAYFTKSGLLKWDQTGTNLQNVTSELRDCFIADPNHDFFQCDLTGADAWTVAADLAALGHTTMLDDLRAGIRPAKVLLLMLDEFEAGRNPASINALDRQELARRTKAISFPKGRDSEGRQGDWKYLCMKRVQHGTNYGMQPDKLSLTIFKDSDGTIDLSHKDAGIYQYLYRLRYNPDARTEYIERQLRDGGGKLVSAAGFQRKFYSIRYGAKIDPAIVREALAWEPQVNTTYATSLALHKLWYDQANRTSKGALFIEPLLQIHDALAGQWGQRYRDWAIERIRQYFNNPLIIHSIEINIPFEGKYGTDWRNADQPI